MGKQLSTPTSTFAVEYTKQASNHAVKFPVSAMNTEVEGPSVLLKENFSSFSVPPFFLSSVQLL